jgi:hypothetical protein
VQHHNNYTHRLVLPFLSCRLYSEFWRVPNQYSGGAISAFAGAPFSSFSVGPRCFRINLSQARLFDTFHLFGPVPRPLYGYTVVPSGRAAPLAWSPRYPNHQSRRVKLIADLRFIGLRLGRSRLNHAKTPLLNLPSRAWWGDFFHRLHTYSA